MFHVSLMFFITIVQSMTLLPGSVVCSSTFTFVVVLTVAMCRVCGTAVGRPRSDVLVCDIKKDTVRGTFRANLPTLIF